jgi:CspA family cold shock protein
VIGTVKWFDERKGYGFIAPEDGSKDVFVHYTAIDDSPGYRKLGEKQRVEFETVQDTKGPKAAHVRILQEA